MTTNGKNRIMIFGPKDDGTYVVEFRTAAGEVLAISIPRSEAAVIRYFQERMPYGLFVPEAGAATRGPGPFPNAAGASLFGWQVNSVRLRACGGLGHCRQFAPYVWMTHQSAWRMVRPCRSSSPSRRRH